MRRRSQGMTLIEVMIVVIIMALIATAVGMAVIPMIDTGNRKAAETDCATIRGAVEAWHLSRPAASCPSVDELVDARILNRQARTNDPWGNDYRIECFDEEIIVSSAGRDGVFDTDDDVPAEET